MEYFTLRVLLLSEYSQSTLSTFLQARVRHFLAGNNERSPRENHILPQNSLIELKLVVNPIYLELKVYARVFYSGVFYSQSTFTLRVLSEYSEYFSPGQSTHFSDRENERSPRENHILPQNSLIELKL